MEIATALQGESSGAAKTTTEEVLFGSCCHRNTERHGNNVQNVTSLFARCHCTPVLSCYPATYAHDFECVLFWLSSFSRLDVFMEVTRTLSLNRTGSEFDQIYTKISSGDVEFHLEIAVCSCACVCAERQPRVLFSFRRFDQRVGRVYI